MASQFTLLGTHIQGVLNGIIDAVNGKAPSSHNHDDRYYTETETNNLLNTKVAVDGSTMTGNINWAQTDRGLTWAFNTDGAYIKFFNTGDGDTNSRLEFGTSDNGNEFFRWTIAGVEEATLKDDGLRVTNSIWSAGNLVATQSWVTSQGYLTSETDSQELEWNQAEKLLTISNGNAVDLSQMASVADIEAAGFITAESDTLATVTSRGATTNGNIVINGNVKVGTRLALQPSYFGYSSSYKTLLIGSASTDYTTDAVSLAFNVDITGNPSGSFNGSGHEYIWRNAGVFITPNSINNGYNTLLSWSSSGQITFTAAATFSSSVTFDNDIYVNGVWSSGYGPRNDGESINFWNWSGNVKARISTSTGVIAANDTKLSLGILDLNSGVTPTQFRINTKIPFASSGADFTVNIKGFRYGNAEMVSLSIGWHYYADQLYNRTAISNGAWSPTITMAKDSNGFVVIHLSSPSYWPKMYVESVHSSAYGDAYSSNWSWTDADLSDCTDVQSVTYRPLATSITGNSATTSQTNFSTLTLNSAGVATQSWVQSQGYLTSETDSQTLDWNQGEKTLTISNGNTVTLDGLATEDFVTSQGYITGYTEADTLASVTGRGASTSTAVNFGANGGAVNLTGLGSHMSFKDQDNIWNGYVGFDGNTGRLEFPGRNLRIVSGYNGTIELNNGTADYNSGTVSIPWGNLSVGAGKIYSGNKNAIDGSYDSWLRLNNTGDYTSGVYTPAGLRNDGAFINYGGIYGYANIQARKAQTAGDYTTAALWTESYDNTATGIAFHISGNVGKFLEMRTDGILYWEGAPLPTQAWVQSQGYLTSETDSQELEWNQGEKTLTISNGNTVDLSQMASVSDIEDAGFITGGPYLATTAKAADSNLFDGIDSVNFVYGNAKGTNDSVTTNNDDLDKTGYYTSGDFATKPSGVPNWMYIEHIKLYNSNTLYQKQIGYDTYGDRMWVRTKSGGAWSGWKQIWTSGEFANNSTNWNTAYDWGNHASAGYQAASTAITTSNIASQSVSYATSAGSSGYASYTPRVAIEDTRAAQRTPNDYEDYRASWEFTNQIPGLSGSTWWSLMTVQGWHDAYSAWQIIGPSDAGPENWYLRVGNNTTWGTARRIWHAGDFTSTNISNWSTAYGWGNHADYGYWNTDSVDAKNVKSAEVVFAGNVTVEGTFTESSSIRFKENITPLDPALDKVNQLEAVSYNKIGVDDREIGLIAEDVAELFPEVVTYNEEGQPQGIQYQRLSVILLKAVQELTERVNKLENK